MRRGASVTAAQGSARGLGGHSGAGFEHWESLGPKSSRRKPPYSRQFKPGHNGDARVIAGWVGFTPRSNCLVLPPDESPAVLDWTMLRGCHVLVSPPPGARVDHALLRQLAREVARAGAAAALMYDGRQVVGEYWADPDARPKVQP